MPRQLTPTDIIHIGYQYEVHAYWGQVRVVAMALFGARVAGVTIAQVDVPVEGHVLRGVQIVATDAAGLVLHYDFTTPWWVPHLPTRQRARYATAHLADLAASVGSAFPPNLREALQALCEERLGMEFLQQWEDHVPRTWMFDCRTPPPVATQPITTAAGEALAADALIAVGREHAAYQRWAQMYDYVRTLYDPRATTAKVIFFSRYNDSTYDSDVRLEVRDAEGQRLYYDLHLPWWRRYGFSDAFIAAYDEAHQQEPETWFGYEENDAAELDYYEDVDTTTPQRDVRRLAELWLNANFIETPTRLDEDAADYDLSNAPPLTYPPLWIAAD